jgi:nucleotide-binding universal stress UspA family protein
MTIVVGVDGSPGSLAALRFALVEGRLRGEPIRLVHAWGFPAATTVSGPTGSAYAKLLRAAEDGARGVIEGALAAVAGETDGLELDSVALEGAPARALVEESAGATLLVVGSRGHGALVGSLLGSVGLQVVQHACCPVAVVHTGRS